MSTAATRLLYMPESAHVAKTLLTQLREAHRELMRQISAMEKLTSAEAVDPVECAGQRWRLSQASLTRRLLAARICDYFLRRMDPAESVELKALVEADQALLRASSAHLGRWSAGALHADWSAFCRDSRDMLARTQRHIAREQQVLYPQLERLAEQCQRLGNGASDGARTRDLRRDRPAL